MRTLAIGSGLLLASALAHAHAPLPDATWCSAGRVVPVGQFQFTPQEVQDYASCLRGGPCATATADPANNARGPQGNCDVAHCGQFDDDYGAARRMANSVCAAYVLPWSRRHNADYGTTVELVDQVTYNGDNHHADYHAAEGLTGQCGRCEDQLYQATPLPPLPPLQPIGPSN